MLFVSVLIFSASEQSLRKVVFRALDLTLQKQTTSLRSRLDQLSFQIDVISKYPAIQGIIRSRSSDIDSIDQSTLVSWKKQLQEMFSSIIEVYPHIKQVRYLDERGVEIVRVNSVKGVPEVVIENDLQDKSGRLYFQESINLPVDQYYISPIELNVENGEIEYPYVPVVRIAKPFISKSDGLKKGVVILNIGTDQFFKETIGTGFSAHFLMIDQDGELIFNPSEPEKEFGLILKTGHNYFKEQPELRKSLEIEDDKWHIDTVDREYRIWQKFYYDPHNKERFWVLIYRIEHESLFAQIAEIKKTNWMISFITIVVVCFCCFYYSIFDFQTVNTPEPYCRRSVKRRFVPES